MKLYEIDHPYYFDNSTYREDYDSFDDFLDDGWGYLDKDLNFLFRWDWENEHEFEDGSVKDVLELHYIQQRKGLTSSAYIRVAKEDEQRVREFLKPYFEYVLKMWKPFNNDVKRMWDEWDY